MRKALIDRKISREDGVAVEWGGVEPVGSQLKREGKKGSDSRFSTLVIQYESFSDFSGLDGCRRAADQTPEPTSSRSSTPIYVKQ